MGYAKQAGAPLYCFIHCAATRPNQDITAKTVDGWHKNQGWPGIAYAYFIRLDGKIEKGAPENVVAWHAGGKWNARSFGICYAGGVDNNLRPADTRTEAQKTAMLELCRKILKKYPHIKFIGHNAVAQKACPSFDWIKWCKENDLPYFDPRAPKKTISAGVATGVGTVIANEATEAVTPRLGLFDALPDPEIALSPVKTFFEGLPQDKAWVVAVLGAISLASLAYAGYRGYRLGSEWLARRNAPVDHDGPPA